MLTCININNFPYIGLANIQGFIQPQPLKPETTPNPGETTPKPTLKILLFFSGI